MTTKLETYAISHDNSSNELIRETPYSVQETVNSQQFAILKKHFPSCFDKNGAFVPHKLNELIGSETEVSQEFYELNWLGRSYAKYLRNAPPEMLMTEDTKHNAEPINQDSQNLLIQGDNLEVLKHLKNAYAEQVKMIYIDPPYNTGSDGFVYQDDRKFTPQQLSELANVPIEEAERILAFTAKGSNSHSAWLTFMYPRLYVARELLKDDGVIFISIDDNEQAQLKLLCDDIFGEENCLGEIIWKNATDNNPSNINIEHEYIFSYAKSKTKIESIWKSQISDIKDSLIKVGKEIIQSYPDVKLAQKEYSAWFRENKHQLGKLNRYKYIDKDGIYTGSQSVHNPGKEGYRYDVIHPVTGLPCKQPLMGYRFVKSSMDKLIEDGKILYGKDHEKIIELKVYAEEFEDKLGSVFELDGRTGAYDLTELFGISQIFTNPKPVDLLKHLLSFIVKNDETIIDFFSGSGTTAHAVMQLNAEDGGNRQFIAVQIAEATDSKSEAFKAGYHTIFDITKERIIRASQKIREENPEVKGDFGFKIYKTTPQLINHNLAFDLNQPDLPELLELQPDDYLALLTTWRLYDGAKLTETVTDIDLDGYTAHLCKQNLYLIYPNFQPKHLIQLIKLLDTDTSFTPNRVVMLGETIDSSRQNEIYQALKDYANKKSLDLSVIVRNI